MPGPTTDTAAPAGTGIDRVWRADLDPVRLPATDAFTDSQLAILRACLQLFADYGYHGTSVRDIAEAVGIKSASLYKSFQSKLAMLDALTMLGYSEFRERMLETALTAEGGPAERFAAQVRTHLEVSCELPRLTTVIAVELRNLSPEVAGYAARVREEVSDLYIRIMERGEAEGVFEPSNHDVILVAVSSYAIALAQWFPYAPEVTGAQIVRDYVLVALRMLGAEA